MKPIKKVTVDFSGLKAYDLNGKEYVMPDANKDIGNALYVNAQTIEMETLARTLHSGKKTECTKDELELLKAVIQTTSLQYLQIAKKEFEKHIDKLIKQLEK